MRSHRRNRSGLFPGTLDRFPPADSGTEECSGLAHNSETNIVVAVAGVVVVATRGTAIPGIIVPRTAAFGCLPLAKSIGDQGQVKDQGELSARFGWLNAVASKYCGIKDMALQAMGVAVIEMSLPTL
jgi:hypothetical protein